MEDWEARLAALEKRLREWDLRFRTALESVRRERKLGGWLRKPRSDELRAAAEEARRRAGVEVLVEMSAFLDALCDHYVGSLPQERAKIRARVGAAETLFDLYSGYVDRGPDRIRGPQDEPQLLRGLIAVVIDDMRVDLDVVDDVLGRFVIAAAQAGIEWRGAFATAASVANPGAGGGGTCMREHLLGFERSLHFRRSVETAMRSDVRRKIAPTVR